MRANVEQKKDVVERIQDLLILLQSNADSIAKEIKQAREEDCLRLQQEMQSSSRLKEQVESFMRHVSSPFILHDSILRFLSKLRGILDSVKERRHKRWYSKLWFANQDADFLATIQAKIVQVTEDFKV